MAVIEEVVFVLGSMLGVTVMEVVMLVLVLELVLVFGFPVLGMLVVGSLVLVLGFVLLGTIVVGFEIVLVLVLRVFGGGVGVPQKSGGSLSVYPDVGSMTSLAFVNASMRNKMY